jgi:monoamine oxidase
VIDQAFPMPVELGAEFVHGRPAALLAELERAGIHRDDVSDEHWWFDGKRLQESDDFEAEMDPAFQGMSRSDRTFRDHLATLPDSKVPEKIKSKALMYVEGLDAADSARVGTKWLQQQADASEAIAADMLYRAHGSYTRLIDHFDPGDVQLRQVVTRMKWLKDRVEVQTETKAYRARAAVVTLPLGVLKDRMDWFEPALPEKYGDAMDRLTPGPVVRALLAFDSLFWEEGFPTAGKLDPTRLGFVHSKGLPFPTVWTSRPHHVPLVTAWAGGPAAEKLSGMEDPTIIDAAVTSLATMLGLTVKKVRNHLRATRVGNWQADPFSRGAYTYGLVGSAGASKMLQTPVAGTLFLAGEHTHDGLVGTVDAAIASGLRAARQVLTSRLKSS